MLKAIHAMESRDASEAKAESVAGELESMGLKEAAKVVREGFVGTFPDGKSALMLVAARLKYVADGEWGSRRRSDASLLEGWPCRRLAEFAQNY